MTNTQTKKERVGFTVTSQVFRSPWLAEPGCPHLAVWVIKHPSFITRKEGAKLCKKYGMIIP